MAFAQLSMVNMASLRGIELTTIFWFIVKLLRTSFIVYVDRQLEISTFLISSSIKPRSDIARSIEHNIE